MAKIKFTPSPGYIFVKPEEDANNYIKFINKGSNDDDRALTRGRVAAVPHMEKTTLRGNKDMPVSSTESVTVKIGDIVLYCKSYSYTIEIDGDEYHLIDNWSVKAKL